MKVADPLSFAAVDSSSTAAVAAAAVATRQPWKTRRMMGTCCFFSGVARSSFCCLLVVLKIVRTEKVKLLLVSFSVWYCCVVLVEASIAPCAKVADDFFLSFLSVTSGHGSSTAYLLKSQRSLPVIYFLTGGIHSLSAFHF